MPRAVPPLPGRRRFARAFCGAGLAAGLSYLGLIAIGAVFVAAGVFRGGEHDDPLSTLAILAGLVAMVSIPPAFIVGLAIWLLVDKFRLLNATSGALLGGLCGLTLSMGVPVVVLVFPVVGALSGAFAVRLTDRWLPVRQEPVVDDPSGRRSPSRPERGMAP